MIVEYNIDKKIKVLADVIAIEKDNDNFLIATETELFSLPINRLETIKENKRE